MYKKYGRSKIGEGTIIGDNVVIGYPSRDELKGSKSLGLDELKEIDGATIGNNCTLRDFGIIYSRTVLGESVQTGHHYLVREKTDILSK